MVYLSFLDCFSFVAASLIHLRSLFFQGSPLLQICWNQFCLLLAAPQSEKRCDFTRILNHFRLFANLIGLREVAKTFAPQYKKEVGWPSECGLREMHRITCPSGKTHHFTNNCGVKKFYPMIVIPNTCNERAENIYKKIC